MKFFSEDFIQFFNNLEENNNREWFKSNKTDYEKFVKNPFTNFITELILRLREEYPLFVADPKKAIFRIYRDIRFSKDKTPYKKYTSAIISYEGRKNLEFPGYYLELSHKHFSFYGGAYSISKDRLTSLRRFIVTYNNELKKLLNDKNFKTTFGEIKGEENKILPPEFKEKSAEIPLLYKKQFYFHAKYPSETILTDNFSDFVFTHYLAGRKMTDFILEGMGFNQ